MTVITSIDYADTALVADLALLAAFRGDCQDEALTLDYEPCVARGWLEHVSYTDDEREYVGTDAAYYFDFTTEGLATVEIAKADKTGEIDAIEDVLFLDAEHQVMTALYATIHNERAALLRALEEASEVVTPDEYPNTGKAIRKAIVAAGGKVWWKV